MSASDDTPFVCIHGHFYQPPRENPWLDAVEVQDSAAPHHDWNDRITAESYAPNAAARLLDADGFITGLRNNYNSMSFNFGPTLLSWMERARPNVYAQIVLADQESKRRLGRGNAIAQVYGHCIMPLAARRDQRTQVRWGVADFVHRFGRMPEGMWLPETAVDLATLTVLAESGLRFTILSPSQAKRVRYGDGAWEDLQNASIDTARPYRCHVGGGREMTLFFYDAEIAHAIAFGGLLNDGRDLAARLTSTVAGRSGTALAHVATDGESYGHHHRFGEMALAAAIDAIERERQARLTNYAAYLDQVAVCDEVEVWDNSSWSCVHGVERWRADCGCNAGHAGWTQAWRAPLREAMDWLKGQLDDLFERQAEPLLRDPWAARDAYAMVMLQRDGEHREAFLERQARKHLPARDRSRAWKLLEMQRFCLLTFTSCGWFFDEPSGLETVQVLTYAARALQLAADFGAPLENEFLHRLQPVRSNLPMYADGRHIYRHLVRPLVTDHPRIMAHYAMNSLVQPTQPDTEVYAYRVHSSDRTSDSAGTACVAVGRAELFSEATEEREEYVYAALHLGGHDMHCAVAPAGASLDYQRFRADLTQTFVSEPLNALVRRIDRTLGGTFYTLRDVFVDEQRRLLDHVTAQVTTRCTADYERIVSDNRRLLDFVTQAHAPLPEALRVAATYVVERRLETAVAEFLSRTTGPDRAIAAHADARRWGLQPSTMSVRQALEAALVDAVIGLGGPDPGAAADRARTILDCAGALDVTLDTWEAQNQFYVLVATQIDGRWPVGALPLLQQLAERLSFHLGEWQRLGRAA
jgi:alpha-amylase/alpha-mannosidase (GH57 family)